MSACEAPMCRICNKPHWAREPHILPKNAPVETRSKRKVNQEHHDKVLKQAAQALGLTTNGADTNCRTLRTDPRTPEGVPGTGRRGMNGQREVSRQGIVRPTHKPKKKAKRKAKKK
jgi:hypothetical protein